jgi:Ring finger domain
LVQLDFERVSFEPKSTENVLKKNENYSRVRTIDPSTNQSKNTQPCINSDADKVRTDGINNIVFDDVFPSEIDENFTYMIKLPLPGEKSPSDEEIDIENGTSRHVPVECAICLSNFQVIDRITWSPNVACRHVFHENCILNWFRAFERGKFEEARRERIRSSQDVHSTLQTIHTLPLPCPICRQDFIMPNDYNSSNESK